MAMPWSRMERSANVTAHESSDPCRRSDGRTRIAVPGGLKNRRASGFHYDDLIREPAEVSLADLGFCRTATPLQR